MHVLSFFMLPSVIADSTRGIAVDNVHCYFYWSDTAQLKIRRSNLVSDHFGNNDTIVDIVHDGKSIIRWVCLRNCSTQIVNRLSLILNHVHHTTKCQNIK